MMGISKAVQWCLGKWNATHNIVTSHKLSACLMSVSRFAYKIVKLVVLISTPTPKNWGVKPDQTSTACPKKFLRTGFLRFKINGSCKLFRMIFNKRYRKPILDDQPFIDKLHLDNLGLVAGKPYALCVTWDGVEHQVKVGWCRKGKGLMALFVCPVTGALVERLYRRGRCLVSRHAMNLGYASQSRGQIGILEARASRIRWRLNDPLRDLPSICRVPIPAKPKAMRWPAYWLMVTKLETLYRKLADAELWNELRLG